MPDPTQFLADQLDDWLQNQSWLTLRPLLDHSLITAYEHPYGFVVCRIEQSQFSDWQLRIHLWPSTDKYLRRLSRVNLLDQQVHSHGWGLRSKVVVGAIEESDLEVRYDAESEYALYTSINDYGPGASRLKVEQRGVVVRTRGRTIRTPGDDVFVIAANSFHASRPASDRMSATVVLTEMTRVSHSYVVAPEANPASFANIRRPVYRLRSLIRILDGVYQHEVSGDYC